MYDDGIFKQFCELPNCTPTVILRKQLVILCAHTFDPVEREDIKISCSSYIKMIISFMDKKDFVKTCVIPVCVTSFRGLSFEFRVVGP